ncbi:hypothetical protein HDU93_000921, partial [Gonapodya sp. JEL0774]
MIDGDGRNEKREISFQSRPPSHPLTAEIDMISHHDLTSLFDDMIRNWPKSLVDSAQVPEDSYACYVEDLPEGSLAALTFRDLLSRDNINVTQIRSLEQGLLRAAFRDMKPGILSQ